MISQSPQPWLRPRSAARIRLLAVLSTVLLVGFSSTVVLDLLPPRLNEPLRRRIHSLRRWAAAAALGFLLLVPLQVVASPSSLWPVIQRSLRVLISAPAYATAFAAMSVNTQAEVSLLDRLLLSSNSWRGRRSRKASKTNSPADYIRKLSGEKE